VIVALLWVLGIVAVEALARRLVHSRAQAWLIAYAILLVAALLAGGGLASHNGSRLLLLVGIPVALVGYQVGRLVLGDKPKDPPRDSYWMDAFSVGLLVPIVEELTWGARVETEIGIALTAVLFAGKHIVIDRRWKRFLGLAFVWAGLGLVRQDQAIFALILHIAINQGGVALGHGSRKDQF
jgi:hypothetical protein